MKENQNIKSPKFQKSNNMKEKNNTTITWKIIWIREEMINGGSGVQSPMGAPTNGRNFGKVSFIKLTTKTDENYRS